MTTTTLRAWLRPLGVITAWVLVLFVMPTVYGTDPYKVAGEEELRPPDLAHHILGTDQFGRDILARCLWGAYSAVSASFLAALLAVVTGGLLGGICGYWGGWIDDAVNLLLSAVIAIPGILIAMIAIAGAKDGLVGAIIGVGIALTPPFARIARRAVMLIQMQPYIDASRSLGAGNVYLLIRHVLPNCVGQLLAGTTTIFTWAILNLVALDFLGLTGSVADPRWGRMIADGRGYLTTAPWIAMAPSACIVLVIITLSLIANDITALFSPQMGVETKNATRGGSIFRY